MKSDLDLSKLSIVSKTTEKLPSREHLVLLDKPLGKTSFNLVAALRKASHIQKIGHAGTLDPFATGVMLLLVGKTYTRLSPLFLNQDKEYLATVHLGISTDTFDCDGKILNENTRIPTLEEIQEALKQFQGTILQLPPMFSAKKQGGKKLYELARKGIEVAREKVQITLSTMLLSYEYPRLELKVSCSKGTYIRSIAHDLGTLLGTGAHLSALTRTRSGAFHLADCLSLEKACTLYTA
ncbi:MAG: tRNA pseudouridine(55) synthase TruB [Chlamydiota bacterium]